ncbi:MAG TPA: hypothetical protein VK204_17095 [Nocardioidaceae bacterium]|nr:hypothetical protein [Nocardioidaceae bacterium]
MTEYEQGGVYLATVKGVPNVVVIPRPRSSGGVDGWLSTKRIESAVIFKADSVTDIRQLVVLDPKQVPLSEVMNLDVKGLRSYADSVEHKAAFGAANLLRHLADQIEAQTKPPRIPEPGLWGVVATGMADGSSVDYWTHGHGGWVNERGEHREWPSLDSPTLVREGISA